MKKPAVALRLWRAEVGPSWAQGRPLRNAPVEHFRKEPECREGRPPDYESPFLNRLYDPKKSDNLSYLQHLQGFVFLHDLN